MNSATLVKKLWNYCNILRDDGLSYGDYVEQLTFLAVPEDGRRAVAATVQQALAGASRIRVTDAAEAG